MKTSADSRSIGTILKGIRDQSLIPKPHFQRRAVWTSRDKVALIKTILEGYPFPEIYIVAGAVDTVSGVTTELLVDGQQRVRTIDEYFKGLPPFKTNRLITTYKALSEPEKKSFLSYDVAVRSLGMLNDDQVREVFKRMNSTSYDLNDMERHNAVFLGEFKQFSESAAYQLYSRVRLFSPNDLRRMKDVSFAASLAATMMSTYFHRDEEIETYLERYNEAFPEKRTIAARLMEALAYFEKLALNAKSRAYLKADFYTLFVEIDRQLGRLGFEPDAAAASQALSALFDDVSRGRTDPPAEGPVKRYFEATLQNVNDRGSRLARGEVIRSILESVARVPHQVNEDLAEPIITRMGSADDEGSEGDDLTAAVG